MVADKSTKQRKKERLEALFRRNFHSVERILFIQDQPCELTGIRFSHLAAVHNAHAKTRGSGGTYKDIVPLCREAHRDFDEMRDDKFEEKYGRTKQSVRDRAPFYQQLWEESCSKS